MRKILTSISVFSIALMARAAVPATAQASADPGDGVWKEVCCGSLCQGGTDYCIGVGERTCCK